MPLCIPRSIHPYHRGAIRFVALTRQIFLSGVFFANHEHLCGTNGEHRASRVNPDPKSQGGRNNNPPGRGLTRK
ncbi:hypothetical protein VTJ83DRAFT_6975 [Remersonia thermophila]|uniref:Uncharacterized protein n=1 Tax=Remersonia thermophila TaxID=72144 RepID=A0ABR4D715_9PEZI